MKDVDQWIRSFPALGEIGLDLILIIRVQQGTEDQLLEPSGSGVEANTRIKVGWRSIQRKNQFVRTSFRLIVTSREKTTKNYEDKQRH